MLFALAVALRLPGLARPEIGDESAAVLAGPQGLGAIVDFLVTRDAHPPLYFFLLHVWGQVSQELWWLRLLSVAFGAAACVVIHRLGVEAFGAGVGRAAFALVALSPLLVFVSQYLRPYALAVLLSATAVLLVTRVMRAADRRAFAGWLAALTACQVLLLYSYYLSLFVVLALNLFLLLHFFRRARGRLPAWVASLAVIGVAYLPWLPHYSVQMARVYSGASSSTPLLKSAAMGLWIGPVQVGAIAKAFLALLHLDELRLSTVRVSAHWSKPALVGIVLVGGLVVLALTVAGYRHLRARARPAGAALLVLLVVVVPVSAAAALSVAGDLGLRGPIAINVRYFGESAALFALVLAAGLARLRPRVAAGGSLAALCLVFAVQLPFVYRYPFNDQARLLAFLDRNREVGLVVSFPSGIESLFEEPHRQRFRARYRQVVVGPDGVETAVEAIARTERFYFFQVTTAERTIQFPRFAVDFETALGRRGFVKATEERMSDVLTVAFFERRAR